MRETGISGALVFNTVASDAYTLQRPVMVLQLSTTAVHLHCILNYAWQL